MPFSLEYAAKNINKCFNVAGYIPVVSTATGAVRGAYGLAKIIVGIAAGIFCAIAEQPNDYNQKEWRNLFFKAAGDGFLHTFRGCVEIVPIAGNIICMTYDFCTSDIGKDIRNFNPMVH